MSDLQRLAGSLVQMIRSRHPVYLEVPFRIQEIYDYLVPYRAVRDTLGIETNEDYELVLLRLLSGEGDYLDVPDQLAEKLRGEVTSVNPDISIYRTFAQVEVRLGKSATSLENGTEGEVTADKLSHSETPLVVPRVTPQKKPRRTTNTSLGANEKAASSVGQTTAKLAERPSTGEIGDMPATPRTTTAAAQGGKCRYCSGALPVGRDLTYCPHCGQDLTLHHCPACSTEMEVGWKFCVACGRGVGD